MYFQHFNDLYKLFGYLLALSIQTLNFIFLSALVAILDFRELMFQANTDYYKDRI